MNTEEQKVSIVGLGYVGLPLAVLTRSKSYEVTGIDLDIEKVDMIQNGNVPFIDKELSKQLKIYPIVAQSNYDNVASANIIIVCVPTPVDADFMPDLSIVKSVCNEIGSRLQKNQLVIIESTINPGVCDDVIIPILERQSKMKCGRDFYLAHCPERINPGDKNWNVSNIPRVVGANDHVSLKKSVSFYESIISGLVKPMDSIKEAEAVKVVENSFRDINIAFVNELAMSFSMLGIDVVNVIDGAATKPFAFMPHYPGAGVGGHCIPVDPYYLIEYAKSKGFTHRFLNVAREINNGMPQFVVQMLQEAILEYNQKNRENIITTKDLQLTMLGLSYKPNVGDLRESPALKITSLLSEQYARVLVQDPYIDTTVKDFSQLHNVRIVKSISDALKGSRAIIIATAHNEYLDLDFSLLAKNGIEIIIDGRNCLDKHKVEDVGIVYKGIGR
jgi:UDP-N-acetyl-D-glucosamine dehydrogenase